MHPETAFLDKGVRPDAFHELLLAEELAGTLDKGRENFAGTATEPNGLVALEEQLPVRKQTERSEADLARNIRGAIDRHSLVLPSAAPID